MGELVTFVGFQMNTCEIGRPAFAETYAVAGRFICVEAEDRESALLFRRYFAGWHVSTSEGTSDVTPDATIAVMSDRVPASPIGFEVFETAVGGICRTDGRTYFFESDGSVIRVRAESPRRVEVWVGPGPASRERAALARLIFDASMTALRRCGLFELHGAGVVEPLSGTGFLIIGPSGSGKSTLTTQLARAGWNYLSDDSLLLHERGAHVEARALRRVFAVTEPTVAAGLLRGFEELLTEPAPFDPLKRRFEPREVFPERFAEGCLPRAIFFPTITRATSSHAHALSQAETMRLLIKMCPWACYDQPAAKAHLSVLARLARQAKGYELLSGSDLIGDAAHVSSFLRRCLEREES
jgi:hypothetical protein